VPHDDHVDGAFCSGSSTRGPRVDNKKKFLKTCACRNIDAEP
jgi:hypothetical protein